MKPVFISFSLALVACDDGAEATCEPTTESVECQPLYAVDFDEVQARTLGPSCSINGRSCHASEGARAGLVYTDVDTSYASLVSSGMVVPGQPECSVLMQRLDASGSRVMPPGRPLSEEERCVIRLWIAQGAQR